MCGEILFTNEMIFACSDRPDMTLDVYRGRKTTIQYNRLQRELRPGPLDQQTNGIRAVDKRQQT